MVDLCMSYCLVRRCLVLSNVKHRNVIIRRECVCFFFQWHETENDKASRSGRCLFHRHLWMVDISENCSNYTLFFNVVVHFVISLFARSALAFVICGIVEQNFLITWINSD